MAALVATLALAVAIRVYIALRVYHYFIDDAYIFMRYATNFATGRGLDFNPGEAVLGYTSPLYTLTLALLARALRSADPGLLIAVLNSLLLGGFAVVAARLFLNAGHLEGTRVAMVMPAEHEIDAHFIEDVDERP